MKPKDFDFITSPVGQTLFEVMPYFLVWKVVSQFLDFADRPEFQMQENKVSETACFRNFIFSSI
jgi:hypothetical protein